MTKALSNLIGADPPQNILLSINLFFSTLRVCKTIFYFLSSFVPFSRGTFNSFFPPSLHQFFGYVVCFVCPSLVTQCVPCFSHLLHKNILPSVALLVRTASRCRENTRTPFSFPFFFRICLQPTQFPVSFCSGYRGGVKFVTWNRSPYSALHFHFCGS